MPTACSNTQSALEKRKWKQERIRIVCPVLVQPSNFAGKGMEADLAKREAELNAREAELKRWEADLRSSGRLRPKKNWPKCCPITVMDIKGQKFRHSVL